MSGFTGHRCPQSGIWQSNCGDYERIALSIGEVFPPCGNCRRAVSWTLVQRT